MRLATANQIQKIDELTQSEFHISGETLMSAAGQASFDAIRRHYVENIAAGPVIILCGPGNNGGDGLIVAQKLWQSGSRTVIIADVCPSAPQTPLRKQLFQKCRALNIPMIRSVDQLPSSVELFVDAIFGISLKRAIEANVAKWMEAVRRSKSSVVALDVPSGLHADTGRVLGHTIKAARTLTFGLAKPGFFMCDGPETVGHIEVLDIGFPQPLVEAYAKNCFLFTEREARSLYPVRSARGHKANFGKTLIIAGSDAYWGSGILASHAAFRVGSGYVTWASFEKPLSVLKAVPEVLLAKVSAKLLAKPFDAVVIGPGLGVSRATAQLIKHLKTSGHQKVVVDADALATAARYKLFPFPSTWVSTPHAGELSRVLDRPAMELENDRMTAAMDGARQVGGLLLYKGFRTVISNGTKCSIMAAGNSALAKAGSGDVLSGFIGGFMAQGLPSGTAAQLAAYLHGRLSEEFVRSGNHASALMPSDLFVLLPSLIAQISARKF